MKEPKTAKVIIRIGYFVAGMAVLALLVPMLLSSTSTELSLSAQQWRMFDQHANEAHLQVAIGNFMDVSVLHKFGRNPDVDSGTPEDVWAVGGDYVFPAAAETVDVVSTDTDDDGSPVGAGARTLMILGLDSSYAEVQETVTLDGVTPVTTTQTFLRVLRAYVVTAGATGTNEGAVSATNTTSGDDLFSILVGKGQTTLAVYTVPDGKVLLVTRIHGSNGKQDTGSATLEFIIREEDGAFRTVHYLGIHSQGSTQVNGVLIPPFPVPARTDIKIRVSVRAANTDINAGFDGYLVTR